MRPLASSFLILLLSSPAMAVDQTLEVPGFSGRPVILHLPPGTAAVPLVVAFHGGGGVADSARKLTCPGGKEDDPGCLTALADAKGFAVAFPNGTAAFLGKLRTWNAGGGTADWQCVSGRACKKGVDDIAYTKAMLDAVEKAAKIDPRRVYATGISNGGAFSHRVACEMSDRFAAIASLAGGNQLATGAACSPQHAVPVMEIHGTEDPCWRFTTGGGGCLQDDGKNKVGVAETMKGWVERDGCNPDPVKVKLPDTDPGDGTTTTVSRWTGCHDGSEVVLYEVSGGGHTWPRGFAYMKESRVGKVAQDFSANEAIWEFFSRFQLKAAQTSP